MIRLRPMLRDDRGAGAAEFALVLPLLLLLLLGIIDAGRFMWEYNRAEKATQMGVRYAVVTNLVPAALTDYSFAVDEADADKVAAGDSVPIENFESASCNLIACDPCVGGDICANIGYDGDAFAAIVGRMKAIYPQISAENVKIVYRNVGLGFSGDPTGPDVAALVTVTLDQPPRLKFQPIVTTLFGVSVPMPDFRASLTLEDGQGNVSN